jgi:hypothetical protein
LMHRPRNRPKVFERVVEKSAINQNATRLFRRFAA